jgi:hypothetical protein
MKCSDSCNNVVKINRTKLLEICLITIEAGLTLVMAGWIVQTMYTIYNDKASLKNTSER